VGNLPYEFSNEDLAHVFAAFGEVISAAVIMDRATGRSKGFGFVEMAHITEEIIHSLDGAEIWGRKVTVSEARPKSETERTSVRSRPQGLQPRQPVLNDGVVLSPESTQDAALDSPREPVPTEVQSVPDVPVPDVPALDLPTIRVEIILPGTEMAKEADKALSGVGG
jgi:RNA recognition motif-containing protein